MNRGLVPAGFSAAIRNAKGRIMRLARALMRCAETGKHDAWRAISCVVP